jgi:hypothetical protein
MPRRKISDVKIRKRGWWFNSKESLGMRIIDEIRL